MNRIARYENVTNTDDILKQFALLTEALNQAPKRLSNLFARPKVPSPGVVEWYSPIPGQPVPYSEITGKDYEEAKYKLDEILNSLAAYKDTVSESAHLVMINKALTRPADHSVYFVTLDPIITLDKLIVQSEAPTTPEAPPKAISQEEKVSVVESIPKPQILSTKQVVSTVTVVETTVETTVVSSTGCLKRLLAILLLLILLLLAFIYFFYLGDDIVDQEVVQCSSTTPEKELMILFDGSRSMLLNIDADPDLIKLWELGKDIPEIEVEPTRLTIAKDAVSQVINKIPSHVNVGLVTALNCYSIQSTPFAKYEQRNLISTNINNIKPEGGTALARGLREAGKKLDPNKPATILVISDGQETCRGNPCKEAIELVKKHPNLKINVIDILGAGAGNCLAEATGGQVFRADNAKEINKMLLEATENLNTCD